MVLQVGFTAQGLVPGLELELGFHKSRVFHTQSSAGVQG